MKNIANNNGDLMTHKYLKELGSLPYPFNQKDYPEPDNEYGFDTRETYELIWYLVAIIYERLRYFQDGEPNEIIDFTFHKFDIHGETLTQEECVERMVRCCRIYLDDISEEFDEGEMEEMNIALKDEASIKNEAVKELFYILGEVAPTMWW